MVDITHPTRPDPALRDRLTATTVAHRDAQEIARRAAKDWKATIVEAIDVGMPYAVVADLAGVTRSRVHHIVAADG